MKQARLFLSLRLALATLLLVFQAARVDAKPESLETLLSTVFQGSVLPYPTKAHPEPKPVHGDQLCVISFYDAYQPGTRYFVQMELDHAQHFFEAIPFKHYTGMRLTTVEEVVSSELIEPLYLNLNNPKALLYLKVARIHDATIKEEIARVASRRQINSAAFRPEKLVSSSNALSLSEEASLGQRLWRSCGFLLKRFLYQS